MHRKESAFFIYEDGGAVKCSTIFFNDAGVEEDMMFFRRPTKRIEVW